MTEKEIEKYTIQMNSVKDLLTYGPRSEMLSNYPISQDAKGMDELWRKFLTFIYNGLKEHLEGNNE